MTVLCAANAKCNSKANKVNEGGEERGEQEKIKGGQHSSPGHSQPTSKPPTMERKTGDILLLHLLFQLLLNGWVREAN